MIDLRPSNNSFLYKIFKQFPQWKPLDEIETQKKFVCSLWCSDSFDEGNKTKTFSETCWEKKETHKNIIRNIHKMKPVLSFKFYSLSSHSSLIADPRLDMYNLSFYTFLFFAIWIEEWEGMKQRKTK